MKKISCIAMSIALSLSAQSLIAKTQDKDRETVKQNLSLDAQSGNRNVDLNKLVSESELIFKGTVIDVSYKDSEQNIPHTFVTYQIDHLVAGKTDSNQITLRFMGGQQKRGHVIRYLAVSDIPSFTVMDSDIVFVQKNSVNLCPLVSCSRGRFKDIHGVLTNSDGQPLIVDKQGFYHLSDVIVETNKSHEHLNGLPARGNSNQSGEAIEQFKSKGFAVEGAQFIASIEKALLKTENSKLTTESTVKTADIALSFSAPEFSAVEVKEPETTNLTLEQKQSQSSDFDRWEESMLEQNGGNPVIGHN